MRTTRRPARTATPHDRDAVGWRRRAAGAVLVALLVAVLAACSGADDSDEQSDALTDGETAGAPGAVGDAEPATDMAESDEAAAEDRATAGRATDGSAALPAGIGGGAFAGRDVIRTAELELRDDDTRALVEAIETAVDRIGGFVAAAELAPNGSQQISGHLTLRVPNDRLDSALADLAGLADEVGHRRLSTEDVTEQLTDMEAQLTNLRMLEAELRELLTEIRGGDPDAQQVLAVFERLREVRGQIEQLEARRASVQDRVALSTVTVVVDPIAPAFAVAEEQPWRPGIVIEEALATTKAALQSIADALIWLVLTALPVALVLGAPAVAAYLAFRRRKAHPAAS